MNIDLISFKVWSSRLETPSVNNPMRRDEDSWPEFGEPDELHAAHITIEPIFTEFSTDGDMIQHNLGFLHGIYFDIPSAKESGDNVFDVFDCISGDTSDLYRVLFDSDGNLIDEYVGITNTIFYLDLLYINDEYRNQGVGGKLVDMIKKILKYSLNLEAGCLIVNPIPIRRVNEHEYSLIDDDKEEKRLTNKLKLFYKKLGYKNMPNETYMYINTNYRIRKLSVIKN
ncbi:GNAT family N-acetyltransferase [Sporomusa sp. KB1]|uniref:GNAT family N-acetyltransferase n=1 Tax=Sporomusa sp. KB1 TaxID=943346 RepID=UPI0011ACD08C|nr:GNAT family N-acetyltransferase [Sporomusa sp. KB1]TWH46762.1 acetyltransferase (GNAT) family protein [Sporomusa sp. KB1]